MGKKFLLLSVLLLSLLPALVVAQQSIFTSYGRAEGLPSDYVFCIFQDRDGYMWFGTERGAARYDGKEFQYFEKQNGLPDNFVYDIFEDSSGRIWFAVRSSVASFLKHDQIEYLSFASFGAGFLSNVTEDQYGRIYFKFGNGIGLYHNNEKAFFSVPEMGNKESKFSLLADGRIFFSTYDKMFLITPTNDLELEYHPFTCTNCENPAIYSYSNLIDTGNDAFLILSGSLLEIEIDGQSFTQKSEVDVRSPQLIKAVNGTGKPKIIVGSRNSGTFIYENGSLRQIITSEHSTTQYTTALLVDYENNIWSAFFGEGVEKITDRAPVIYNQQSGLPDKNIWRVQEFNGEIYTSSQNGITKISPNGIRPGGPNNVRISRGIAISDDYVYLADIYNIYRASKADYINGDPEFSHLMLLPDGINDLQLDKKGRLLAAIASGNFMIYDERSGTQEKISLYSDEITSIESLSASGDAVWLLTYQEGCLRYGDDDEIKHFTIRDGLADNHVFSVYEDSSRIYFATNNGLTLTDKKDEISFGYETVLPGQRINGVFPAEDHHPENPSLWLVTSSHIHRYQGDRITSSRFISFLNQEKAHINRVGISGDKKFLNIATTNGFIRYNLTEDQPGRKPPKVNIETITFDGEMVPAQNIGDFKITGSSVTVDFSFSGLSFIDETAVLYRYKLSGIDPDWSTTRAARTIRYANIPDGNYTFSVMAVNAAGDESEKSADISFVISKPFWKTNLFFLLLILSGGVMIYVAYQWRVAVLNRRLVRKNEQQQFETIQRITATIAHDIKNSVTSLGLLSRNLGKKFENEDFRRDAVDTLESTTMHLSSLMKKLQESRPVWKVNYSKSNIKETICTVVKRCRLNLREGITLEFEPDSEIDWMHDPNTIERILENLIHNSIDAIQDEGIITIKLEKTVGGMLRISVNDNGCGMSAEFVEHKMFKPFNTTKEKGLGLGLFSANELVKAHQGVLKVKSEVGKGTEFVMEFNAQEMRKVQHERIS